MSKTVSILVAIALTTTLFSTSMPTTFFSTEAKAAEVTAIKGVSLNKNTATLKIGQSYTLTSSNKNLTWMSNDNNVATVDSNGKITAVSNGVAVITATTQDGSAAATCNVTVVSQDIFLHYDFSGDSSTSTIKDSSIFDNNGTIEGSGATVESGQLTLPGGSNGGYVELPKGMFDGHNTLTISMWLKNDTGKGNYSAMFFGTTENYPSQYWLFNPCNPSGKFKSVITNSSQPSSPWNTEAGISPTDASKGIPGPTTDNNWGFYTTVIEPNQITAYYNGEKIGTVSTSRTISKFGNDLVSYIGKSSYSDPRFKGAIRDLKVYTSALSEAEIKEDNSKTVLSMDRDKLILADTSVVNNITLPYTGANGSTITWKSSNPSYVTDDGKVTRPTSGEGNKTVTMTATISKGGVQLTKDFNIVVLENSIGENQTYLCV